MIKNNLPLGLTQDRRDDGTTRLTLFADIIFDHEHLEVAMRLIAASMEIARAVCPHAKWEWRKGHRFCLDCEQWIPAFPPLEDLAQAKAKDTLKGTDDAPCSPRVDCKHTLWQWRRGKEKGTSIRFCADCKEVLPYDENMVRDHNPFVFSCEDPACRQCREYPNREIHGEHCLCTDCRGLGA